LCSSIFSCVCFSDSSVAPARACAVILLFPSLAQRHTSSESCSCNGILFYSNRLLLLVASSPLLSFSPPPPSSSFPLVGFASVCYAVTFPFVCQRALSFFLVLFTFFFVVVPSPLGNNVNHTSVRKKEIEVFLFLCFPPLNGLFFVLLFCLLSCCSSLSCPLSFLSFFFCF
jgi:hypothetical protein